MINTILSNINKDDFTKVFKSLSYSIYQDKVLSFDEVNYLNGLIKRFSSDDQKVHEIFSIDSRYELNFKNILEEMSLSSCKTLLFLFAITAEVFENNALKKYLKNKVLDELPFDPEIENELLEVGFNYVKSSIKIYDLIYSVESKGFFSKKDDSEVKSYEKLDFISEDNLLALEEKEKNAFIKILIYLMLEDGEVSEKEKAALNMCANYFELKEFDIDSINMHTITLDEIKTMKTAWFINLLIFSYVLSQNSSASEFGRLFEVTDILNINKKELSSSLELINDYKVFFEKSLSSITSTKITSLEKEKTSENIGIGYDVISIIVSALPFVGSIEKGINLTNKVSNMNEDNSGLEYGLCRVLDNTGGNEIIICIDGFMSESSSKQFDDWSKSFKDLNINSLTKGFKWPSKNLKSIGSLGDILGAPWYEAVNNTSKAADKLVNDIKLIQEMNSDIKITLMGHSLGSRVIFNTLIKLNEMDCRVENVYMLGGAVSRIDKAGWLTALSSVNNKAYNFYSSNDEVLNKLYQTTMMGDKPIGLGNIECYKNKDFDIADVVNIDVSHIVNGHTEYKDKFASILNDKKDFNYSVLYCE